MGDMPLDSMSRKLILASSSPRRRELLDSAGYEFCIVAPEVPERIHPDEVPEVQARRLALEKGRDVAGRAEPDACVLAADTLVVIGSEILGKPSGASEAEHMLRRLAGRTHRVLTGFAVIRCDDGLCEQGVVESQVRFREVTRAEARAYASSGEPLDKAGGYALQGEAARFVTAVEGSRRNVIGLPLEALAPVLERFGVVPR